MKIDVEAFREARRRPRLSRRAVAASAGTSGTVVFNLEKTGDVTHLSSRPRPDRHRCGLSIFDRLRPPSPSDEADSSDEEEPLAPSASEIVSALLANPDGLLLETLAALLSEPSGATIQRLQEIDTRLRSLGLGIASSRAKVALVGAPRERLTDSRIREAQKRLGTRRHITRADAKVVYAVFAGAATLKGLRVNADGHLRTGKLVNAGVIQSGPQGNRRGRTDTRGPILTRARLTGGHCRWLVTAAVPLARRS
jgi:hypothetical protein